MPESLDRARTFARRLKVLKFLDASRMGIRPVDLQNEVQTATGDTFSMKTLQRDIEGLQQAGFDIAYEKTSSYNEDKVYVLKRRNYIKLLNPSDHELFSTTELLALGIAHKLLYPLAGTPLWEGIQSFCTKVREALPATVWKYIEKQEPLWYVQGPARKDYSHEDGKLSALNRAMYEHRVVEVEYQSLQDDEPAKRLIHPYGIVVESNSLFIIAINESRDPDKYKPYKLERFARVKLLDRRFTPRDDYDPEEYFRLSRGVFTSDDVEKFRIRYDKALVRWAEETPFHTHRVVEHNDDGSVTIEIEGHFREMVPRILGLGAHAEILSPPAARERVREILAELTERYVEDVP